MIGHAEALSTRWYEECQEHSLPTDAYSSLRQGLSSFLSADALAGIAYRDDHPFVLALTVGALVFFEPPEPDRQLKALALPIATLRALSVDCSLEGGIRANYRVCKWTLRNADLETHSFVSRRAMGNRFDSDNGGESVMLALADRLGWTTPLYQQDARDEAGGTP